MSGVPFSPILGGRVDITGAGTSPSPFSVLPDPSNARTYRVFNKNSEWGNVLIVTDAQLALTNQQGTGTPVTPTAGTGAGQIPNFTQVAFGVPIPPNDYIDYRIPNHQQAYASCWLDTGSGGTFSIQAGNT
jgi:hypothetical protein